MKSHIYQISLLILIFLGVVSCTEHDVEKLDETQCMELTVSCVNLNATRTETNTMGGEDNQNENLIKTLHYFLYPSGKTDENAVLAGKIDIAEGTKRQTIVRIPMDETLLNYVVFPRPYNDCKVYLIANLPSTVSIDLENHSHTSLSELKSLAITTNFKDNLLQEAFVMDGEATAIITSRNQTVAATGTILLERLAAKFTTRISVANSFIDTDGKVWTPQLDQMQVHMDNAVSNTTLGATFGDNHFDYAQRHRIGTKTEAANGVTKTLYVFAPFYSYPCQWEYLDEDALAIYIKLPWQYTEDGATRYKDCYYKVFPSMMQLDRNSWYNMDLHIGVLGSFTQTVDPIVLEGYSYKVAHWTNGYEDWSAGLNINTDLLSAHYLVVEKNEYVVNNKNQFEIPFITSHKCIIKENSLTVTRMNFGTASNPTASPENITSQAKAGNWLTVEGNVIKLNHELNNDFESTTNKNYDYTPYVFTFTLCHENNQENFNEIITITQKPAISVTAHLNSLYDYSKGKTITGYVYVNGNAAGGSGSGKSDYGGVAGVQTSGTNNTNPYMYTIEVSVLPAGSEFILGDPRVKYEFGTDIAAKSDFCSAPPVEGGNNRTLTNYYGTIRDASAENMIAPKFRMASAHGRVSSSLQGYANTLNRAASYQEDGYPAGRWRVPTMAEIRFVTKLYADGKIPPLFSSGTGYWSATGRVTPSDNGTVTIDRNTGSNATNSAVRCVYDEWYWDHSTYPRMASRGNHPNKYNQFTWGDEIN
ncbi:MAG: hypothetical protein IKY64_08095 [Bacteroidaceae bacterium]|nr:hypothetical protein [Bacteroidaceae bacterium]